MSCCSYLISIRVMRTLYLSPESRFKVPKCNCTQTLLIVYTIFRIIRLKVEFCNQNCICVSNYFAVGIKYSKVGQQTWSMCEINSEKKGYKLNNFQTPKQCYKPDILVWDKSVYYFMRKIEVPAFSMAPCMAIEPSWVAGSGARLPRNDPTGVLTALAMTTSWKFEICVSFSNLIY